MIDIVNDVLDLMANMTEGQIMEFAVLDFADAFFKIPLLFSDRRCYCTSFQDVVYVWRRIAQGSKNGPQIFGRQAAMVARLTQGMMDPRRTRLHIYTDDSIAIMIGTKDEIRRGRTRMILVWKALCFDLAFHKAQAGSRVDWIGHTLVVDIAEEK